VENLNESSIDPGPKDLKEEMSKLDIDWAEYLGRTIGGKVRVERMRRACRTIDELRED